MMMMMMIDGRCEVMGELSRGKFVWHIGSRSPTISGIFLLLLSCKLVSHIVSVVLMNYLYNNEVVLIKRYIVKKTEENSLNSMKNFTKVS